MKLIEILRETQDIGKVNTDIFDAEVDVKIVDGKKYIEFELDEVKKVVEVS